MLCVFLLLLGLFRLLVGSLGGGRVHRRVEVTDDRKNKGHAVQGVSEGPVGSELIHYVPLGPLGGIGVWVSHWLALLWTDKAKKSSRSDAHFEGEYARTRMIN